MAGSEQGLILQHSAFIRGLVAVLALLVLLLAMDTLRLFGDQQWLGAFVRLESQYFYGMFALLLPAAFLLYPTRAWIDWPLALAALGLLGAFFVTAEQALDEAWEFAAPQWATYAALGLWLLVVEALRRSGGVALCVIATLFSILPLVTEFMPASAVLQDHTKHHEANDQVGERLKRQAKYAFDTDGVIGSRILPTRG